MNIIKFKKKKGSWYELILDNNCKLILHEDLILKYDLLLKKNIDLSIVELISSENNFYLAYDKSLKYISIKMRSALEIREYLKKHSFDNDNIDLVIKKLYQQNYLNDEIFSKSYVHDRIVLSNDGPSKIYNFLIHNGIDDNIVNNSLIEYTEKIQIEKINKCISKFVLSNNNKGSRVLKQKIYYYLLGLGFDTCLINNQLNKLDIDDSDIYKKEYDKLFNKLSSKYSGKELEYKIKQKLYQKGFIK